MDAAAFCARGDRRVGSSGLVSDQRARGREMLLRTVKSCGPDASTPASNCRMADRPDRARIGLLSGNDGDKKPITGESTKETVKTIARGMPGEPV